MTSRFWSSTSPYAFSPGHGFFVSGGVSIPNVLALAGTSALGVTSSSYSGLTSKATFVITYVTGAGITGRIDYSINGGAYTGTATIIANPSAGNATITVPINAALQGTTASFLFTLKDSSNGAILTKAGGATLNPADTATGVTLSNSNLSWDYLAGGTGQKGTRGTANSTGKLYYEATIRNAAVYAFMGFVNAGASLAVDPYAAGAGGTSFAVYSVQYGQTVYNNAGAAAGTAPAANDVIGMAVDTTAKLFWLRKNGTWQNGDPVAATGGHSIPSLAGAVYPFISSSQAGSVHPLVDANFLATPPTGFVTVDSIAITNVTAPSTAQITYPAIPLTVGINAAGVSIIGELSTDLMDYARLSVNRNGAFRDVADLSRVVNSATAADLTVDATDVAADSNYMPTRIPFAASVAGYINTDPVFYFFDFFNAVPAGVVGTYDVAFHPSIVWTLAGNGATMTLSNYNQGAGTATLAVSSTAGNTPTIRMTAFASAGAGYFRAIKQGSAGARIPTSTKTSLGGLTSTNNRGFVRWMGGLNVNRTYAAGVSQGTYAGFRPATAVGTLIAGDTTSLASIVEIATATNTNPWICVNDTASAAQVTAIATYLFNNMPVGMKCAIEYSNEMWNFQFQQAGDLNTRATSASVSNYIQYAREYTTKVLNQFEAVFGVNSSKLHPVLAWQQANIPYATLAAMLNEGSLYTKIKGFAVAPYVGGGINGQLLGDYTETSVFTQAQRDTVITPTTGKATFKTNMFAAQQAMSNGVKTVWNGFASDLATYCVSKSMAAGAIRPAAYETMWQHILPLNTPTASSQDVLTKQAFAEALRDSRAGAAQTYMLNWFKQTGGDIVDFAHLGPVGTTIPNYGLWSFCDYVGSEAQEPYASTATWITANT